MSLRSTLIVEVTLSDTWSTFLLSCKHKSFRFYYGCCSASKCVNCDVSLVLANSALYLFPIDLARSGGQRYYSSVASIDSSTCLDVSRSSDDCRHPTSSLSTWLCVISCYSSRTVDSSDRLHGSLHYLFGAVMPFIQVIPSCFAFLHDLYSATSFCIGNILLWSYLSYRYSWHAGSLTLLCVDWFLRSKVAQNLR